jgi:hypothetical protein
MQGYSTAKRFLVVLALACELNHAGTVTSQSTPRPVAGAAPETRYTGVSPAPVGAAKVSDLFRAIHDQLCGALAAPTP